MWWHLLGRTVDSGCNLLSPLGPGLVTPFGQNSGTYSRVSPGWRIVLTGFTRLVTASVVALGGEDTGHVANKLCVSQLLTQTHQSLLKVGLKCPLRGGGGRDV